MDLLGELWSTAEVEVDTALLPTFRLNISQTAAAPPGLASKLLDARISVFVGGQQVFPAQPYPARGPSLFPLLALAGLGLLVWRLVR